MNNLPLQSDVFSYSLKLGELDDNEISYLANSLGVEKKANKNDTIINIINKIQTISKEEFQNYNQIINDLLNKQKKEQQQQQEEKQYYNENKKDYIKDILNFDKIFLLFSPEINPETKLFSNFSIYKSNYFNYIYISFCYNYLPR